MKKLIFATQNPNKVKELNAQVEGIIKIESLLELGHHDELAEDHETLEENAAQKATFIFDTYKINCFSEDTGLEIVALDGQPGVHTAHYSGSRNAEENIALVLQKLKNEQNRNAQFRTIIHLIFEENHYQFEGIVKGKIANTPSTGNEGFGYDPIFIPDGYTETFADLSISVKKNISHRAQAVKQLIDFLELKS